MANLVNTKDMFLSPIWKSPNRSAKSGKSSCLLEQIQRNKSGIQAPITKPTFGLGFYKRVFSFISACQAGLTP